METHTDRPKSAENFPLNMEPFINKVLGLGATTKSEILVCMQCSSDSRGCGVYDVSAFMIHVALLFCAVSGEMATLRHSSAM